MKKTHFFGSILKDSDFLLLSKKNIKSGLKYMVFMI